MTWKRVATAALLVPLTVGVVLWGSTAIATLATALITLLALFEYFALGEAIGHRALPLLDRMGASISDSPYRLLQFLTRS